MQIFHMQGIFNWPTTMKNMPFTIFVHLFVFICQVPSFAIMTSKMYIICYIYLFIFMKLDAAHWIEHAKLSGQYYCLKPLALHNSNSHITSIHTAPVSSITSHTFSSFPSVSGVPEDFWTGHWRQHKERDVRLPGGRVSGNRSVVIYCNISVIFTLSIAYLDI